MFRQTIARNARLFSTSVRTQKSAVDAAKDAAKTVDKTVSQTIVKGIEGAGTSKAFSSSIGTSANQFINRERCRKDKASRWCRRKGG